MRGRRLTRWTAALAIAVSMHPYAGPASLPGAPRRIVIQYGSLAGAPRARVPVYAPRDPGHLTPPPAWPGLCACRQLARPLPYAY
jgi:hypothetical protein